MGVDKRKQSNFNPKKGGSPGATKSFNKNGDGKKFSAKSGGNKFNKGKPAPKSLQDMMKKNGNGDKKSFDKKKPFDKKKSFDGKKKFNKDGDGKGDKPKGDGEKKFKKFDKNKGKGDSDKKAAPVSSSSTANYRMKKPHFKLVETIKSSWNKVRDHSTANEARQKLVADMVKNIKTHIIDVTLRHDASRMVQTILQFGNNQQKDLVLAELHEKMFEIAKSPYGHFVILKAITYCNEQPAMKKIVSSLQKHFVSLGTHVIGARTVESILQLYPANLTRGIKAEFYGKNFTILASETPKNLHDLIEILPNKRTSIMDHMRDLIQKFVQKQLLEFTYVHHLLYEYTQELQSSSGSGNSNGTAAVGSVTENDLKKNQQRIDELINQLADSAPKLLSTKPGAKVMCFIITFSNAKDRKRIIKSLKGHCLESLLHDSAFLGIMRLVDVTDDTVNIQKSFFDELKVTEQAIKYTATGEMKERQEAPWLAIAKHPNASKLLLRLLAPQRRHLEPDEEVAFQLTSSQSKKDPELRRKEHLTYLRQVLVKLYSQHTEELIRSRSGSKILEAMIQVYHPKELIENVGKVFAGIEVTPFDNHDEDEEDDGEEEEEYDEEGEEEGDYDEEGEEDDGAMDDEYYEEEGEGDEEGDEMEEEEGDDNEEDDEEDDEDAEDVDDEEYDEQLKEAEEDLKEATNKKSGKGGATTETPVVQLLPIEEDPVAHIFLKRLLKWEAGLESEQSNGEVNQILKDYERQREEENANKKGNNNSNDDSGNTDKSLWISDKDSEETVSVSQSLFNHLSEDDHAGLLKWTTCNRASFALHELLRVPSIATELMKIFNEHSDVLTESSLHQHEGGKVVWRLYQAFVAAEEAKKAAEEANKKKKGAATPAKGAKTPFKTPKKK